MNFRKFFRILSGSVLIIVGVAGLVLPFVQGVLCIIAGLVILADYFPPIRRLLKWAKRKVKRSKEDTPTAEV
ncbi:MAG: hypothetical protein GY953_30255 [bacterium]|nr:hypothetical protein [bacterium]